MFQLAISASFEYLKYLKKYFHSYCAAIDFRRQNLTSMDVRF